MNDKEVWADSAENVLLGCTDAAIFAEKLAFCAEILGYNLCYIGGVRNSIIDIDEALRLPKYCFPLFGLTIGHAKTENDIPAVKPRLPLAAVLHTNTYNTEQTELIAEFDRVTNDYYLHRSSNPKDTCWSKDMATACCKFNRPFVKHFLVSKGFTFQ